MEWIGSLPYAISIHAPARGATKQSKGYGVLHGLFQSTLPRGERQPCLLEYPANNEISIHAPARGATDCILFCVYSFTYFNPRSREGSDEKVWRGEWVIGISIHAPARGATNAKCSLTCSEMEFQSTLPRGERQQIWTNHICKIERFAQFITNKKGVKAICLL